MKKATFEIYAQKGKYETRQKWRWRLFTSNGENIARSEEPFASAATCKTSVKRIQFCMGKAVPYFRSFEGKDGKHYWSLIAKNNKTVAIGGQGFETEERIDEEIALFRLVAKNAEIVKLKKT